MIQILFLIKSILATHTNAELQGNMITYLEETFFIGNIFISLSDFCQHGFIKMWKLVHGPHFNDS